MNVEIRNIPRDKNEWDLTREIAKILHSEEFDPNVVLNEERKLNFQVKLDMNEITHTRNIGTGILTLPTLNLGHRFLRYVRENPLLLESKLHKKTTKLYFCKSENLHPSRGLAMTLEKTKYTSPDLEEKRQETMRLLDGDLRVDFVQFGTFYRSAYTDRPRPRSYSVEWSREFCSQGEAAWLKFEYNHKLIRVTLGDSMTQTEGHTIAVSFASISRIGVGNDPRPYICFCTHTPPVLEKIQFYHPDTEGRRVKTKQRVAYLPDGHDRVSAFAQQLRIVLYHDQSRDIIEEFKRKCKISGLSESIIADCNKPGHTIEASGQQFFSGVKLHKLEKELSKLDWPVAFQLSCLLHNCILTTAEIFDILPRIHELTHSHPPETLGDLMKHYTERLRRADHPAAESPLDCLHIIVKEQRDTQRLASGQFECCHVTFTPTRCILEGPYPTQSNRVIRQYPDFNHHFIRVEFRDEDRLSFRWERDVDGSSFLKERVGGILKNGFTLAGRTFEFLAYSNSALREHSVWFMSPFVHPTLGRVDSARIRSSLGDFKKLLKNPSKYAARLAQAFTATDPSVSIQRHEWEEVNDLGPTSYLFTDGVGTISETLGRRIWEALLKQHPREASRYILPSAYQIRFLGFKGMVGVDKELDKDPRGIHMRLRESMKKFESVNSKMAEIEIARAFERPNDSYLNRPLVMVLEDRQVHRDVFLELQRMAVAEARTIHDSLSNFSGTLESHYFGSFHLPTILQRLEKHGFVLHPNVQQRSPALDGPFLKQVREVVMVDILRDIKHNARIKLPDSYLLVGLADEGVAYQGKPGYENLFTLKEGQIYACVQKPGEEPTWLEGTCMISRSPVCHPGDVQRVYAIGKPPENRICLFAHMKNVVVLASVGERSLASCLGGGDLDGDLYDVIMCSDLLTPQNDGPAKYLSGDPLEIDHDSTINDICDFVVEYINSDVLGLLSDRWLITADQSNLGVRDDACLKLARLCSQAVDFPKQGIPVDLEKDPLPWTLMRLKPDWHAAEVVSPRDTDYYWSDRALGFMYRDITLTEPKPNDKSVLGWPQPVIDAIAALVPGSIKDDCQIVGFDAEETLTKYCDELRYISMTHTLTNAPGVSLLETEIVAGTILAKCSQKRWRKERIFRLRLHTSARVKSVRQSLLGDDARLMNKEHCEEVFRKAWTAWRCAIEKQTQFGGQSFALLALGVMLDCLEYRSTNGEMIQGARDDADLAEDHDNNWGYGENEL